FATWSTRRSRIDALARPAGWPGASGSRRQDARRRLGAVAPPGLGPVERRIGLAPGRFPAGRVRDRVGEADADGTGEPLAAGKRHAQLADARAQAFRKPVGLLGANPGAADQELLAPGSRHEVAWAAMMPQHAGDLDQDLVAGLVAMEVVDLLEAVDVDLEQH